MIVTCICVMLLTDIFIHTGYLTINIIFINIVSVLIIAAVAPVENYNKQMSDKQKHNNKIKSIIASVFLSSVSVIFVMLNMRVGVTISITLLAVVFFMIIGMANQRGGEDDV